MSSGYLCGSMSLLSEKESLEMWEKSDMFRNMIPQGATAHSFDYLRALVARRAASSSQSQEPAHHQQLQQVSGDALTMNNTADDLLLLPPLRHQTANNTSNGGGEQREEDNKPLRQQAEEGTAAAGSDGGGGGGGLVFEMSATDEATAEMFMQQETEEEEESIRKQKEINEAGDGDGADDGGDNADGKKRKADAEADGDKAADGDQQDAQQNQQQQHPHGVSGGFGDGGDLHAGTRRQRDGTSATSHQQHYQQQQQQRSAARHHNIDVSALAQLLKYQPGSAERYRGRVKTFLFDQGYGFVQPYAATELAAQRQLLSPEEEEKSPLPNFPFADLELFISAEDIMNLGPVATATAGGVDAQTNRAMRVPCPGEEVEFSVVVAQTAHGQNLRAVRMTGTNSTPLIVQMPSMRQRGVVRLWDTTKRFGFLTPLQSHVPPPGLGKLEEGRLTPEAVQALGKSNDVFMLVSNILWDHSVPMNERYLHVGSVVEYTAVLRKTDPQRHQQQQQYHGRDRGGGRDRGDAPASSSTTRVVGICVTDFTYRPVDPQMLERAVGDGAKDLAQAVASGSLQTARPGVLGSLPSSGGGGIGTGADRGEMLLDGMDGNMTW